MPAYKQKDGTYLSRFYLKDPLTGERKQMFKRGFKTKREALRFEEESKLEGVTKSSSATFWEIFQIQLADNDTTKGTRDKKEKWVKKYFSDYKDKRIEDITKPQLVEWRNSLRESGLAVRTMNCGLQYVRSVFAFYSTVYGGQNKGSVLKSYKLTKADRTEMQIWTPDQFNQFLEAVEQPVLKAYFSFLFWTGCRRGEALALTKDCLKGNRCHIYRSIKHYKNGFKPLKTDSSERTITLDDNLMEILKPFIEMADPFVFGGQASLAITSVDFAMRKGIRDSGVPPIRVHDLRHSHASLLLNEGANIIAVSKRLGHATINQTLETYAHLMQNSEDKIIEIIENKCKISAEK